MLVLYRHFYRHHRQHPYRQTYWRALSSGHVLWTFAALARAVHKKPAQSDLSVNLEMSRQRTQTKMFVVGYTRDKARGVDTAEAAVQHQIESCTGLPFRPRAEPTTKTQGGDALAAREETH